MMLAPLKERLFRHLWVASVLANLGLMVQSVGSARTMTRLTDDPELIALVQSAIMAPIMVFAIPAGALADSLDRRKVAIAAVSLSILGASCLSAFAVMEMLTPWSLLGFCFAVGAGFALFSPAWQSSAVEIVSPQALPNAIALNIISYNSREALALR